MKGTIIAAMIAAAAAASAATVFALKKAHDKRLDKACNCDDLPEGGCCCTDEDEVTMEATMQDDLGADSLDLVDLVMSVEEEFGVKVADEDLENIKTVGDIVNYIEERA